MTKHAPHTPTHTHTRRDVIPSFVLMAFQADQVVTYVYELHGTEMKISKSTFKKKSAKTSAAAAKSAKAAKAAAAESS